MATLAAAALCVAWDLTGLDLEVARWAGGARGFPLRDHWVLNAVLHEGMRRLAWCLVIGLWLLVPWPAGPWRRLPRSERVRLALSPLVIAAAVGLLKSFSPTSCPWDLQEFGGSATWISHWRLAPDGGGGHCFPAGHAVVGFGFVGGFFGFRRVAPALARGCLLVAAAAGLALGLAQQLRGAHFMSHTLWSGWISWCVAWMVHAGWASQREAT